MARIDGNGGSNSLRGTRGDDSIYGYGGNDTLFGHDGDDRLFGAAGADRLIGADGGDLLRGGDANDRLSGGNGNDTLRGDSGNDELHGNGDWDTFFGGAGADTFVLHSGVNTIRDWNPSQGDKISLWPALGDFDGARDELADYVRVSSSGETTQISIDENGQNDGSVNFSNIAIVNNASYANLNAMLAEGSLLVPADGGASGGGATGRESTAMGPLSSANIAADGTKNAFMDFLGINIRIDPTHASYRSSSQILNSLKYIGVDKVRVGVESPIGNRTTGPIYDRLADAGIEFNFLMRRGLEKQGDALIDDYVDYFRDFLRDHPGSINSFEGLNEVMNPSYTPRYAGHVGKRAATEYQEELYRTFDADPGLRDIPLYNFTVWRSLDDWRVSGYDNVSNFSDAATLHSYVVNKRIPHDELPGRMQNVHILDGNSPVVITETGYASQALRGNILSVDETSQAKLNLNMILNAYDYGVEDFYLFELFDLKLNDPGDNQSNFGLFKANGVAKEGARALHNFTQIIDTEIDSGPRQELKYDLVGEDRSTHSVALQKNGRVTDVIVWREDFVWDSFNVRPIRAPEKTVTVEFDRTVETVDVYDPLEGTTRLRRLNDVDEIQIQVSDHPIILEVDLV